MTVAFARVEHLDDPRVADYRDVADHDLLNSRGVFVAEGRLVVERLIADGRYRVRSLLLSEAAHRALVPAVSTLQAAQPGASVFVTCTDMFLGITGFDIHRGCLALAERPVPAHPRQLLVDARTIVVLEGVTNADNVGGVFRNAAAFGVDAVLLSPTCCDPLYRKAIRTSMAATLRVPFARMREWPQDLALLADAAITTVALTPRPTARTLEEFVASGRPERIALVVGTEAEGLSAAAEAAADCRVRIPMRQDVDSLNLAVAAGIALSRLSGSSTL